MNGIDDRDFNSNSNLTARKVDSKDISVLCRQAAACFHQQKFAESIALCHQVITTKPDCALAYEILGASLMSQKKLDAAIRAFSHAVAIEPNSVEILVKLGNCLAVAGRLDEAITNYRKSLELNPNYAEIYLKLGKIFKQQKRWQEILDCWLEAVKIEPAIITAESFLELGNFYYGRGNLELAIACYRHLISHKLDCKPAYLNLAITLNKQGKIPEAIATCIQLLQILPSTDEAYNYLSVLLTKLDRDEGVACYWRNIPPQVIREFCSPTLNLPITSTLEAKIPVIYPQLPPRKNQPSDFKETEGENTKPFVAVIPNGRAWGDKYTRATITSDDRLLEDVSAGSPGLIVSSNCLPLPQNIEGKVAFLSKNYCQNYYHWMFEFLPQFELLYRAGIDIDSIDKFAINNCSFPFQRETLNWFRIPLAKIIETDSNHHIQASQLLVSNPIRESTEWACDFLRREFLQQPAIDRQKTQRLYISRQQRRKVIHEDEVLAILSNFGFKIVVPESMSVAEQVSLFANAKVVVGVHGAALTNTVFCSPGTKIIEIFAPNYVNPCYRKLSHYVNLEYYEFIGDRIAGDDSEDGQHSNKIHYVFEDIAINIAALLNLMKSVGAI